ncbi:MAG: acyl-CoA reductase [Candidatus Binataceae bacterium]
MTVNCDSHARQRGLAMEALEPELLRATARRIAQPNRTIRVAEIADTVAAVCERWRSRDYAPRRATVAAIAQASRFSRALLEASFDALLAPFTAEPIKAFATTGPGRLAGFIMPGNVPGAGLHEVVLALIHGAAVMIKTASAEPVFFHQFARSLLEADERLGERIAVFNWPRTRIDLTAALRQCCDLMAWFGDDQTVASAGMQAPSTTVGFGDRVSTAILTSEALSMFGRFELAAAVARDVSLFEQRGCLSPHHVFVEAGVPGLAREFAVSLADALERFAAQFPSPAALALEDAAAVRRAHELARWRQIGGHNVELWEGRRLAWGVTYDASAAFIVSPGYRTVAVSPFVDADDLEQRLSLITDKLEAIALSDPAGRLTALIKRLRACGASYVCAPGMMQSPPLNWPHGGGAFIKRLEGNDAAT